MRAMAFSDIKLVLAWRIPWIAVVREGRTVGVDAGGDARGPRGIVELSVVPSDSPVDDEYSDVSRRLTIAELLIARQPVLVDAIYPPIVDAVSPRRGIRTIQRLLRNGIARAGEWRQCTCIRIEVLVAMRQGIAYLVAEIRLLNDALDQWVPGQTFLEVRRFNSVTTLSDGPYTLRLGCLLYTSDAADE